mgnify:FL=1
MTSKNSFLVNLRVNAKRRVWTIALSAVCLFFIMPVTMMVNLSSVVKSSNEIYVAQNLANTYREFMISNPFLTVFTTILAIIMAIHGFSYLFSRKKVDMYMSVPVKMESRFWAIVLNSFLIFIIPYIICFLLCLVVAGTYGINDAYIIKMAIISSAVNVVYYMAVYSIAVIAVMLTGNLPVSVLGTGTLLLYEVAFKWLLWGGFDYYFNTYNENSAEIFKTIWTSPLGKIVGFSGEFGTAVSDKAAVGNIVAEPLIYILLMAVIYIIVAFLLYKARPMESCGKSMAFRKTKTTIKRLIMIPCALAFSFFFDSASGGSIFAAVFGLLAGVLITHVVIQGIYEQDLKAAFKDKRSVIYVGVIAGVIFSVLRFDLVGYDRYVPESGKLESASVSLDMAFMGNETFFDEETSGDYFRYIGKENYIFKNMNVTDVDTITEIAQNSADTQDIIRSGNYDNASIIRGSIKYTLSGGKTIYRDIALNYSECEDALNRLFANEEYKTGNTQIYSPVFDETNRLDVRYNNGAITSSITDIESVIAAYRQDYKEMTFSDIENSMGIGILNIDVYNRSKNYGNYRNCEFVVFPTFSNTIAQLEKQGIVIEPAIAADDVERIEVNYYDYDRELNETYETTDINEIKEIIENSMPNDFYMAISTGDDFNYDYSVTVYIKSDSRFKYDYEVYDRLFLGDKVPDFIR